MTHSAHSYNVKVGGADADVLEGFDLAARGARRGLDQVRLLAAAVASAGGDKEENR